MNVRTVRLLDRAPGEPAIEKKVVAGIEISREIPIPPPRGPVPGAAKLLRVLRETGPRKRTVCIGCICAGSTHGEADGSAEIAPVATLKR